MSITENKELVRRYFDERWNHANYAVIDELVAPADIEEAKEGLAFMQAAFGNIEMTLGDLIAENDQVVVPWKASAIHQGEFAGVAPSGKRVTVEGLALLRIADGKIVYDVAYGDTFEVIHNFEA